MTEKQTPLFNIGSIISFDQSKHLTPDGKLKGSRKKRSNQPVSSDVQIPKNNDAPSVKKSNDREEMTEYTRWINEH